MKDESQPRPKEVVQKSDEDRVEVEIQREGGLGSRQNEARERGRDRHLKTMNSDLRTTDDSKEKKRQSRSTNPS